MAGAAHLVRRFFGSLTPLGEPASDRPWITENLTEGELAVWRSMSRADWRHVAGVARRVERALGHEATRPVIAAALLHDCGKTVSGLGTYGRVIATLSVKLAGHEQAVAWRETRGFTRRVGLYVLHPELGADRLGMAGSAPLTVAWAAEHHLPADQWTVPTAVGEALKAADDD